MWYNWARRLAGSRLEYLLSLGVGDEEAHWVNSQESNMANIYTSALAKSPKLTVRELKQIPIKIKSSSEILEKETSLFKRYQDDPVFYAWLKVQIRKLQNLPSGKRYTAHDVQLIYDWYYHNKINSGQDAQGNPRFQIAAFDWQDALDYATEWNQVKQGKGSGIMYEPIKQENIVLRFKDGHTVQKITSPNDLKTEGKKLNHCVGGFCDAVNLGKARIFSLRDPANSPIATIELKPDSDTIVQIQSQSNSEPPENYIPYIKEWIENLNSPTWKSDSILNIDNTSVENIGSDIDRFLYESNKYGLSLSRDLFNDLNTHHVVDTVLNKFSQPNISPYKVRAYINDAAASLLELLITRDNQVFKSVLDNGNGADANSISLKFWKQSSHKIIKDMWEDYRDAKYAEILSEFKTNNPEPDRRDYHINYRDYDNDNEYDQAQEELEQSYQNDLDEWNSTMRFSDLYIDRQLNDWIQDDPSAQILHTLNHGLSSNYTAHVRSLFATVS